MFGPIEGKRHDAFMLGVSGLSNKLNRLQKPNGDPYVIYGDPALMVSQGTFWPLTVEHKLLMISKNLVVK